MQLSQWSTVRSGGIQVRLVTTALHQAELFTKDMLGEPFERGVFSSLRLAYHSSPSLQSLIVGVWGRNPAESAAQCAYRFEVAMHPMPTGDAIATHR